MVSVPARDELVATADVATESPEGDSEPVGDAILVLVRRLFRNIGRDLIALKSDIQGYTVSKY